MRPTREHLLRLLLGALVGVIAFCLYHGISAGLSRLYFVKARAELGEGNVEEGVRFLGLAHSWDRSHRPSAFLLARHAVDRGDLDEARRLLIDLSVGSQPSVDVLYALAQLHESEGKTSEARRIYTECSRRYPNHIAGAIGLARLPGSHRQALNDFLESSGTPLPSDLETHAAYQGLALLHLDDDLGVFGYGTPAAAQSLFEARRIGADAMSVRVPGRQASVDDPAIAFGKEPLGGERDSVVRQAIRDAQLLGFRVLLKPHIMLGRITEDEWRGTIHYPTADKRERWWLDYRTFILHYARMAEEEGVDAYCVGVELRAMVRDCLEEWRNLIREVRTIYGGRLTYAANWYHEYEEVPFWDELDLIGIQFFFPLSSTDDPAQEELTNALLPILENLNELALGFDRPVILTEVGYKSSPGTLRQPWLWPQRDSAVDLRIQKRAYEAIFAAFRGARWFQGMFWWNWLTTPYPEAKFDPDFTPQGKPALDVLRRNWITPPTPR